MCSLPPPLLAWWRVSGGGVGIEDLGRGLAARRVLAGFAQQHLVRRVSGQPVRQHRAGGAAADDDDGAGGGHGRSFARGDWARGWGLGGGGNG